MFLVAGGILAVASPASATVPVVTPGPEDILATGQNYDQSWEMGWDSVPTALDPSSVYIRNALQDWGTVLNPANPVSLPAPGFSAIVFVNNESRAFATHASSGAASMGIHAESSIRYDIQGQGLQGAATTPSATLDASYVRPNGSRCALPKCVPAPPYFHATLAVRAPYSQNYASLVDFTQPTPLNGTKSYPTFGTSSIPEIDMGIVVVEASFDPGMVVNATYALDMTGGSVDLSTSTLGVLEMDGTVHDPMGIAPDGNYKFRLSLLEGSGDSSYAVAHAFASIRGTRSPFSQTICGAGKGSFNGSNVGGWTFDADSPNKPHLARSGAGDTASKSYDSGTSGCVDF